MGRLSKGGLGMNFKKMYIIICVTVMFIIVIIIFYRIISLNSRYPQRQEMSIKQGDFYELKPGVEMGVINSNWMESDELEREYGDVWIVDNPEDYKGVDVLIKIRNKSNVKKKFQLFKLYIESDLYDWNGCVAEIFMKKNNSSFEIELEPDQEAEYTVSYTFLKDNYKEKDWENLSQTGYFLVNKRYPLKIKWRI